MARRSRNRVSRRRSSQRGGNYSSASTYGTYVNGLGPAQFARTFDATGPYANNIGAPYIGAQGQNYKPASADETNLSLVQSAGRRRRRGGFLGPVVSQAIVPATLLALQQTYRRKSNNTSRRNKRFSRRR